MRFFRRKTDRPADDCNPNCSYRKGWRASTITMIIGAVGATLTGVAYLVLAFLIAPKLPPVTDADVPALCGWAGQEEAAAAFAKLEGSFHHFAIKGAPQDNAKARAVLWDASRLVNGNRHIPTFRQRIGDCVGAGAKQAVDYLQCVEAIRTGESEFKPVYSPYHYACGRMAPDIGAGKIRGPDGSVGAWQAEALRVYGVIPATLPGLDEYSEAVIRHWATRMPERRWIDEGKTHLVKSAAQVKTPEEVRDAVCNGYPCTIASDVGFRMRPPTKDGRLVNSRAGSWAHQMCVIGYDGSASQPYWYILNSWGADAHGTPPDDAPPGGFWITRGDMNAIVKQGDSFALSQFDGFPSNEWIIITSRERPATLPAAAAIVRRAVADRLGQIANVERN